MNIDKLGLENVQVWNKANKVKRETPKTQASVEVRISDLARKISSLAQETPVETAKIEQIREQIQRGEYRIDSKKIARALLSLQGEDND